MNRAIACQEMALALCPPGHKDRGDVQENLAEFLQRRYIRTGSLNELEDALHFYKVILDDRPDARVHCGATLNKLSGALCYHYLRTAEPSRNFLCS